jgi:hypothetical protein
MVRQHLIVLGMLAGGLALVPAVSYGSSAPREEPQLLERIHADATLARWRASRLQAVATDQLIDWQVDASYLAEIRDCIVDMDNALRKLGALHDVTLVERQDAVMAAALIHGLSVNTDHAIRFLDQNRHTLWMPVYRTYTSNIYIEARHLAQATRNAS